MNQLRTVLLLTLTLLIVVTSSPTALAADTTGATVFSINCAACHANGGNIVRRGKNLKQRALERYGMDSLEAIASLVQNGKNAMPAYKDRLNDPQIKAVSAYVLEQAAKDWK